MRTGCRVWQLYQARCLLCDWEGEITGSSSSTAWDARAHRDSNEHQRELADREASKL